MLELLNIRFAFSLRTSHHNQDGKSAIVLRVSFLCERRDIFTGLYCHDVDWDRSESIEPVVLYSLAISKPRICELYCQTASYVMYL